MYFLLLLVAAARAQCPENPLAVVLQHVGEVQAAYTEADIDAFDAAAVAMEEALPCIDEPVSRELVVQIHLAEGLRLYTNQDSTGAQRALAAVRELNPGWQPSQNWMQEGQPIRRLYDVRIPPSIIPLAARPPGGWLVDGVAGSTVPGDRAFFLQAIGKDGAIAYTGYHTSPTTLPEFDFPTAERRKTVHLWGTATSGLLAAASAGAAGGALVARHEALGGEASSEERVAAQERANTLTYVSASLAGGAVAGGVVTWAIAW